MRLKILVNSTDYSDAALLDQTRISKEISGRVSTAQVSFVAGRNAVYDEAVYDTATYGVDVSELAEIELRDADTDALQFSGFITETKRQRWNESPDEIQIDCTCSDWSAFLDAVIPEETFTGQSDQAIALALIGSYAPRLGASTATVASTQIIGHFEIKDKSLRSALDELRELTGCEYRVDFTRTFHYFVDGSFPAPFGLSTERDEYRMDEYTRDAKGLVNRAIVLGGLLPGGVEIRVQYEDPVSQEAHGVRETTVIDRQIANTAEALLRAQAVVEGNAWPLESGSVTTWKDGLDIGQSLDLHHAEYPVDGSYLIRSMEMSWLDHETTEYRITFGEPKPDVERILRMLEARNRRATARPTAVPADGSVTDASIGSAGLTADSIASVNASALIGTINAGQVGSVNASSIIGQIVAGQIGSVNAAAILGAISASQISSVSAGTIQGAISASQIGSVNATTIQGVIVSSQVADGLINSLRQYSDALKPIVRLASEPALPDPGWTEGSVYYNTTTGLFRKLVSGAWATVTESSAISGKLEYWHVGTIKAGSIIGLIAAGQIDNITAGQIVGAISASQIASVNASAIVGSITASQVASVNASAIQGSISASQIASVNTSSLVGTVSASQISSVAAGTVTGQLVASQISTVNASSIQGGISSSQISTVSASSITGSITAGQIGSINAATVNIGQLQDSQIAGISASKLTAGIIDANTISVINLNATNITAGTINVARIPAIQISNGSTFTVRIDASNIVRVDQLSTGGYTQVTGAQYFVSSGVGPTGALTSQAVFFNGTQVITSRQAAVATVGYGLGPFPADTFTTGDRAVLNALITAVNTLINRMQTHGLIS
jgi:hypothetical protein